MQFLIEEVSAEQNDQITMFYAFVCEVLGITDTPVLTFTPSLGTTSFGLYHPASAAVTVATEGRHISDILRTFAHELVHHKQLTSGSDGTLEQLEYEANAVAGMLMRDYNKAHPEMFGLDSSVELAPDTLGDSQGAVADDTTRPSQPTEMAEEMTAGSGDVAGIGIGPQGEPGIDNRKKKNASMLKRRTFKQFRKSMSKYS